MSALAESAKKILDAVKKHSAVRKRRKDQKTTKDLVNLLKELSQPKQPPEVPDLIEWLDKEVKEGIKRIKEDFGKTHPRWVDGWATGAVWTYAQVIKYYELLKIRQQRGDENRDSDRKE